MGQFKCISDINFKLTIDFAYSTALDIMSDDPKLNISKFVMKQVKEIVDREYEGANLSSQLKMELIDSIYDALTSGVIPGNVVANKAELERFLFGSDSMYATPAMEMAGGSLDEGIFDNSTPSERLASELISIYGNHQYACSLMKNRFDNMVVPAIFVNHGKVVDPQWASVNLFRMRLQSALNVMDTIRRYMPQEKGKFPEDTREAINSMAEKMRSTLDNLDNSRTLIDAQDVARGASFDPDTINAYFNMVFFNFDSVINEYAQRKRGTPEREKLDAYNDLFIIRNTDALIDKVFDGMVKAKKSNQGITFKEYDTKPIYNTIKSWRDEDKDLGAFEQAGSITRSFINTMKYYDYKTKSVSDMGYLGWSRFNSVIGMLKQFVKTEYARYEDVNGRKFIDVLNAINSDPADGWRNMFDFLMSKPKNDPIGYDTVLERIANSRFRDSYGMRDIFMNSVYSIYREMYGNPETDPDTMGLYASFNDFKSNRDLPNYYGFITHYMNGINRIPFASYSIDRSKEFIISRNMDSAIFDTFRRQFDARIYNTSRNMMTLVENEINAIIDNNKDNPEYEIEEGARFHVEFDLDNDKIRLRNFPLFRGTGNTGRSKFKPGLYDISISTKANYGLRNGVAISRKTKGVAGEEAVFTDYEKDIAKIISGSDNTTSLDSVIGTVLQTNISENRALRDIIYPETQQERKYLFTNMAFHVIMAAALNRDYIPGRISSLKDLKDFIHAHFSNTSSTHRDELSYQFIPLKGRIGLNMIPSSNEMDNLAGYVSDAVCVLDNSAFQDTALGLDGNPLGITQQLRLSTGDYMQMYDIAHDANAAARDSWTQMTMNDMLNDMKAGGFIDESTRKKLSEHMSIARNDIFGPTMVDRDAKVGEKAKQRKDFNVNESFTLDFCINYLQGMFPDGEFELSNYTSMFTQVNSDKSMATKATISNLQLAILKAVREKGDADYAAAKKSGNLTDDMKVIPEGYYGIWRQVQAMSRSVGKIYSNIISNIDKTYSTLENDVDMFVNMGDSFYSMLNANTSLTNKEKDAIRLLTDYVKKVRMTNKDFKLSFDYNKNFAGFNSAIAALRSNDDNPYPMNAYDAIFALAKFHNSYGKTMVKVIDQTHLIKQKDGSIKFNPILVNCNYRYNGSFNINATKAFAPEMFIPQDYANPEGKPFFSTLAETFLDKIEEFAYYMLDNGTTIDLYAIGETRTKFKGLSRFVEVLEKQESGRWLRNDRVVLMEVTKQVSGGKTFTYKITSLDELKRYGFANVTSMKTFQAYKENLERQGVVNVTINPYLLEFDFIDFFTSENYRLSTVGGVFNHPTKVDNTMSATEIEAVATGNGNKRNVSLTATYQPWQTNTLNGVPGKMRVACVEDVQSKVSNYSGNSNEIKPHDGVCHMAADYALWVINSTEDSKVGMDMKPFIHGYDLGTASGIIIKSSTNALTNEACRKGKYAKVLMKKTMDAAWRDETGNLIQGDIFNDYYAGINSDLAEYLIRKFRPFVETAKGEYWEIESIKYDGTGYKRTFVRVNEFGERVKNESGSEIRIEDQNPAIVNSNYKLWKLFGGENSRMVSQETNKLVPSENSIKMVAELGNLTGIKRRGVEQPGSQKEVYQFMKHGNVNMIVSNGAIKQGYANINKFDDLFHKYEGMPDSFEIDLKYAGIQLDPTHTAVNSTTSELTQVMSSLGSMGFTKYDAGSIYEAMGMVAESTIDNMMDKCKVGKTVDFRKFAANIIIAAMSESKSLSDEERVRARKLIERYDNGETLEYDDVAAVLNINNSNFVNRVIPVITSYINRISIRKKYFGTLGLIKASYGLIQIYNDGTYEELGLNDSERFDNASRIQADYDAKPLNAIGEARMGHIYKVTIPGMDAETVLELAGNLGYEVVDNGTSQSIYINLRTYDDYKNLKTIYNDNMGSKPVVSEAIIRKTLPGEEADISNAQGSFVLLGRELAPMDYHFAIQVGEGDAAMEVEYNMYDLDAVEMLFNARKIQKSGKAKDKQAFNAKVNATFGLLGSNIRVNIDDDVVRSARMLHQVQLDELNKAYKGGSSRVVIKGMAVNTIPGRFRAYEYETIIPNVNREKFGLDQYTKLNDVTPELFARQMLEKNPITMDSRDFSYALDIGRGRFLYVHDSALSGDTFDYDNKNYKQVIPSKDQLVKKGNRFFFADEDGKALFEYDNMQDIYLDESTGMYIVVLNSPDGNPDGTILRTAGYGDVTFSPALFRGIKSLEGDDGSSVRSLVKALAVNVSEGEKRSKSASRLAMDEFKELYDALQESFELSRTTVENGVFTVSFMGKNTREALRLLAKESFNNLFKSKSRYVQNIHRRAKAKYQAFLQSTRALVARIPSRAMQSFMGMRGVAFDNTGVNAVYVNDMQIWLQGSDLDGDEATFQMFSFDRKGNFIGWSPYFKKDDLENSMRLPFPTGEKLTGVEKDMSKFSEHEADVAEYNKVFLDVFTYDKESGQFIKKFDAPVSPEAMLLGWLEMFKNDYDVTALPLVSPIDSNGNAMETVKDLAAYLNAIAWVDRHNTYYDEVNEIKLEGLKNFITNNSINISGNPVNLYESQSPINDFTLVKDEGNLDEGNKERGRKNFMNAFTKLMAHKDNMMGKQTTAATAVSIKNFYAITQYFNTVGTEGYTAQDIVDSETFQATAEKLVKALDKALLGRGGIVNDKGRYEHRKGITINGNTYYSFANWNPSTKIKKMVDVVISKMGDVDPTTLRPGSNEAVVYAIYQTLKNATSAQDAALILFALLTEATDNAKNLTLSKINATPKLQSIYVYGISIGMDFHDIATLVRSRTARIFSEMTLGNMFYKQGYDRLTLQGMKEAVIERMPKGRPNNFGFDDMIKKGNRKVIFDEKPVMADAQNVKNKDFNYIAIKAIPGKTGKEESNNKDILFYVEPSTVFDYFIQKGMPGRIVMPAGKANGRAHAYYEIRKGVYVDYFANGNNADVKGEISIAFDPTDLVSSIRKYLNKRFAGMDRMGNMHIHVNNWANRATKMLIYRREMREDLLPSGDSMLSAMIEMEKGANEMRNLSTMSGLNKGVEGNAAKQTTKVKRMGDMLSGLSYENAHKLAAFGIENPYLMERVSPEGSVERSPRPSFDIAKLSDPDYREAATEAYNEDKRVFINAIDFGSRLPHLRKYMNVFDACTKATGGMSAISKTSRWIYEAIISKYGQTTDSEKTEISRNVIKFVGYLMMDSFLKAQYAAGRGFTFYIPDGFKYYVRSITDSKACELKTNDTGKPMKMTLKDKTGRMTFLKWMYETVIPNLKGGIWNETDKSRRNVYPNEFIKRLSGVYVNKTLSGSGVDMYTINLNTSNKSEYSMQMNEMLKRSASSLRYADYVNSDTDGMGRRRNILDMLYLVEQFTFNGINASSSMYEYLEVLPSAMENEYLKFVDDFFKDRNGGFDPRKITGLVPDDADILESIARICAPQSSVGWSKSKYIKAIDDNYGIMKLYMKKDSSKKDYGRGSNEYNENLMNDVEETEYDEDNMDYGQYEYDDDGDQRGGNGIKNNSSKYDVVAVMTNEFNNFPEFNTLRSATDENDGNN